MYKPFLTCPPVYCLLLNMKTQPRMIRHSEASNRNNENLPKQKRNLGNNAESQEKAQKSSNQYPQKDKKSFMSTRQEMDATKNGIIRKEEVALGNKN